MIRIAVIAHKDYSGAVRERREVAALIDAGYEVDLLCLKQEGEPYREYRGNLRVYRIPIRHKRTGKMRYFVEYLAFFLASSLILSYLELRRGYRLVQVHNIPDFLVFAAWLPKLRGARILLDIRDPMPETFQFKYGLSANSRAIGMMKWIERVSIRFSDHVLTVHEPLREVHIRRGCPPDRITSIMNLPDEKLFESEPELDWPRSKPPRFVIIYTGTLGERHGVQTALRSLPKLKEDIPGLHLRVIGDGEYLEELTTLADSLGLDGCVSFEGVLPLDAIPEQLKWVDAGIALQEGLFGEIAFPTKAAEYMAMGLPAIVSKTSLTQTYFDDKTVAFVPPGDSDVFACQVRRLYQDQVFGRGLVANGYCFLSERNWAKEKQRYLSLVANLFLKSKGKLEFE